jgi:hypothetical protein
MNGKGYKKRMQSKNKRAASFFLKWFDGILLPPSATTSATAHSPTTTHAASAAHTA